MAESLLSEEFVAKLRKRRNLGVPVIDIPAFRRVCPIRMESVERVFKFPVVEETLKIATKIYRTVKVKSLSLISN
jgi:hypothetical protein